MVEHSTADREVSGSIPLLPFFIIMRYLSKEFRFLKYINIVHYFELPRHMNNDFLLNFIAIYHRLFYFREINCLLRDCSQTKYIFLALGMLECSSVVQHSTADREVGDSIPLAPFFIIVRYLSKDFRCLKYINFIHYFELPRHMNNDFLSNFVAIYHRLFYFREINGLLRDCSQTKCILLAFDMWECSSVVEHSTEY